MNKYELMFIVDPSLDDAKKDEAVEAVKAIIAEKQERYSAFYYHIQNARRRRDKKSCRWHSQKRRKAAS